MNELIAVGERLNKPLLNLESGIGNILDIEYAEKRAFLALSLLYEDANWGTNALHKDHIFPQSMFKAKAMDAAGLPREKQEEFGATYNRLGNLELLLDTDNTQKNDQDFAKWIQTRDSDFKKRHFIPDDPNLWNLASFGKFLERREELITARLRSIIHISKGAPRCL